MFSSRTIAIITTLMMATTVAHAQDRRHPKEADPDSDSDSDSDSDADTAKPKAKAKAKSKAKAKAKAKSIEADADADADPDADTKAKAKAKAKTKAKPKNQDPEPEADADAERERERERDRRERERQREREKAEADSEKAKADSEKATTRATEAASEATSGGGGSGGEAYKSGTLGFSIPFSGVSATTGAGGVAAEPVSTVDIVYFLDDKTALDLIVGLNFHRKQTAPAVAGGATSDTNLIGLAAGLGYRMYTVKNSLLSYLEPQAVIALPDVSATGTLTVNAGVSLGLERSITPWLSISGAVGGFLNVTNSFKDIQLSTSARLAANLYWR